MLKDVPSWDRLKVSLTVLRVINESHMRRLGESSFRLCILKVNSFVTIVIVCVSNRIKQWSIVHQKMRDLASIPQKKKLDPGNVLS